MNKSSSKKEERRHGYGQSNGAYTKNMGVREEKCTTIGASVSETPPTFVKFQVKDRRTGRSRLAEVCQVGSLWSGQGYEDQGRS